MTGATAWMSRAIWLPVIVLLIACVQLARWATDREPPFEVLAVEPAQGVPGGYVILSASVRRDVSRGCSAHFTRYVYDATGARYDLEGQQAINAGGIARVQTAAPNRLLLAVQVPEGAAPGRAVLSTSLHYSCNPLHALWPIAVESQLPFEIVAARGGAQ